MKRESFDGSGGKKEILTYSDSVNNCFELIYMSKQLFWIAEKLLIQQRTYSWKKNFDHIVLI